MRKMKMNKFLAATSLAVTVAAFGCTTNRYPGNGEPTMTSPGYGAANQAVTPGSSSGTNPPMASSYTDALVDAAALQGYQHQARVLGPVNPAGAQVGVPIQPTGGAVVPPAMLVNPQSTINPSVSSPNGDQGITGGVGGGGGGVVLAGAATVSGGSVSTGSAGVSTASASPLAVTGAIGVGAPLAAGTVVPATTATTPTLSASSARITNGAVPATVNDATTTAMMAVTNSSNVGATLPTGTAVTGTTAVTSAPTTAKASATTAKATTSSSVRSIPVTSGLKIQQNSSGQIVVSNTKASTTTPTGKTSTSTTTSVKP
jgi:hypothetical protein